MGRNQRLGGTTVCYRIESPASRKQILTLLIRRLELKANRSFIVLIFSAFLLGQTIPGVVLSQNSSSANLDGFTPEGSTIERRWEEDFRAVPAPGSAREHLQRLTAEPHVAGTKEDYATAIYVRDQIRSYGISSELKEYEVLLPYPMQTAIVELVSPRQERLSAKEPVITKL